MLLLEKIKEVADLYPQRTAIYNSESDEKKLTYEQLELYSNSFYRVINTCGGTARSDHSTVRNRKG